MALNRNELSVGDEVYWNDPDNNLCSGYFTISDFIGDDVVVLVNAAGSYLEAFIHELS